MIDLGGMKFRPCEPGTVTAGMLSCSVLPAGTYQIDGWRMQAADISGPARILVMDEFLPSHRGTVIPIDDEIRMQAKFRRPGTMVRAGGYRWRPEWLEMVHAAHGHPNPIGWVPGPTFGNGIRALLAYHGDFLVGAFGCMR